MNMHNQAMIDLLRKYLDDMNDANEIQKPYVKHPSQPVCLWFSERELLVMVMMMRTFPIRLTESQCIVIRGWSTIKRINFRRKSRSTQMNEQRE